jgi:hypothetical protein
MACLEYWANARGKSGKHGRCSGDLLEALKMTGSPRIAEVLARRSEHWFPTGHFVNLPYRSPVEQL